MSWKKSEDGQTLFFFLFSSVWLHQIASDGTSLLMWRVHKFAVCWGRPFPPKPAKKTSFSGYFFGISWTFFLPKIGILASRIQFWSTKQPWITRSSWRYFKTWGTLNLRSKSKGFHLISVLLLMATRIPNCNCWVLFVFSQAPSFPQKKKAMSRHSQEVSHCFWEISHLMRTEMKTTKGVDKLDVASR